MEATEEESLKSCLRDASFHLAMLRCHSLDYRFHWERFWAAMIEGRLTFDELGISQQEANTILIEACKNAAKFWLDILRETGSSLAMIELNRAMTYVGLRPKHIGSSWWELFRWRLYYAFRF